MGDFQTNSSESRKLMATPKPQKNNFQKMVEYSHTHAATSTGPGGPTAAEIILFPEVQGAATPEEAISTNKLGIIVFQGIKEEQMCRL